MPFVCLSVLPFGPGPERKGRLGGVRCVCVCEGALWGRDVAKAKGIEADLVLCDRCLGNFGSVDVLACNSERT